MDRSRTKYLTKEFTLKTVWFLYALIGIYIPVRARGWAAIAHLGNGASMCALRDGRSVATTMSLSPLDGLPTGTRCGRLDAAVVLHLIQQQGRSADEVSRLLFRESGLLGLSGVSSEVRELEASSLASASMAIDYFVERVLRELAAMAAALRGIETLVFTGTPRGVPQAKGGQARGASGGRRRQRRSLAAHRQSVDGSIHGRRQTSLRRSSLGHHSRGVRHRAQARPPRHPQTNAVVERRNGRSSHLIA